MNNSSKPFRAFLGAILSAHKGVPVPPSVMKPVTALDVIVEDEDHGALPEDDADCGSGGYKGSSSKATSSNVTRSTRSSRGRQAADLMITTSSPHSPESFQVWVYLHSLSNNTLVFPQYGKNGNGKRRLWLSRRLGSGTTGDVWQCRLDGSDRLFAIKVVELFHKSDEERERLKRFHNEFIFFFKQKTAYESGKVRQQIAPRCYGAFAGDEIHVLILELCNGALNSWDELSSSERTQIHELLCDLHRQGIRHYDLEPRNVARVPGGGFRLIDFSASRRHNCPEFANQPGPVQEVSRRKCYELTSLWNELFKRQPLQVRNI